MPDKELTKRINILVNDWKKKAPYKQRGLEHFADQIGVSRANVRRVIKGESEMSKTLLDALVKIGFSPEWLLKGTGDKKKEADRKSTLTDLQALQAQVETMRIELEVLRARMRSYEEREKIKNN